MVCGIGSWMGWRSSSEWSGPRSCDLTVFMLCLTLARGKPRVSKIISQRMDRGVNPSWPVIGGGELKYMGILLRSTTVQLMAANGQQWDTILLGFIFSVQSMAAQAARARFFGKCSLWQWTVQYAFESEWFMVAISHCFRWICSLATMAEGFQWSFVSYDRFSLADDWRAVIDLDWPLRKWHLILND